MLEAESKQPGNASPFQAYPEKDETPFKAEGITSRWIEKGIMESGKVVTNMETGETMPVLIPKRVLIDHDSKTYVKFLKFKDVDQLSAYGKLVLMYVAFHLKVKSIEVELYWRHVADWCGISKSSYYRGVCDLLDKDVLAIKSIKKHLFFVNPNYVYNGDRTKITQREEPPKDERLKQMGYKSE